MVMISELYVSGREQDDCEHVSGPGGSCEASSGHHRRTDAVMRIAALGFTPCVSTLAILSAWLLFVPYVFYSVELVALDEIATWGLKGPHLERLPKNGRGVYYLSGNQEPRRCSDLGISKNKTLCTGSGWKRSGFFLLDLSKCTAADNSSTGSMTITCNIATSGAGSVLAGSAYMRFIATMRTVYALVKDDEFRNSKEGRIEGALHLHMLGRPLTGWWDRLLGLPPYRVTAYDRKGDGSRLLRLTWWGAESHAAQPKAAADKEWTYVMKRVLDERGRVDRKVLREMKAVHGTHAYRMVPRFGA